MKVGDLVDYYGNFLAVVLHVNKEGGTVKAKEGGKSAKEAAQQVAQEKEDKSDDKIVCTAMNNQYGFGSFRQTIWLNQSKTLDKHYQIGYHTIFKPLVRYAYKDNNTSNRRRHTRLGRCS